MRWSIALLPFVVAGHVSCHPSDSGDPASPAGSAGPEGQPPTCDELKTGDFSTLVMVPPPPPQGLLDKLGKPPPPPLPPGTGDNMKILLTKTNALAKTALAMEKDLIDACTELGLAAGVPEGDLKASPDLGHGAERACNAAAARVSTMFRRAKESRILLDLQVAPSRCYVDVTAAQQCLAACGSPAKGDIRPQCVGGEIAGTCGGHCSGTCANPPGAGAGLCHATCSGRCDHDFRGKCGGKCSGTCDGAPTRGPRACPGVCDGSCNGSAEGTCAGRCDGSCSGAWEPPPTGKCGGLCTGVCSGGKVESPACTGEYMPQGTDRVCLAACGAASALTARCDLPQVKVAVRGGKATLELERLFAGIQSAVPKIIRIQQGPGKRLPHAMEGAVTASIDWSNAFATAGKRPLFCIRKNTEALKEAESWIELNLRATEAIAPAIKTDPIPMGKPEDE